jgi:hypothetical protein
LTSAVERNNVLSPPPPSGSLVSKGGTMKTRISALAALLVLCVGCGATVSSTVAPNANLAQYHTFAFRTPHYREGKAESPAEQELRAALRNDLGQKGLMEAAPGQVPDFFVAYHVKTEQKLDVNSVGYGYWWGYGGYDVTTYTQGTLIVDFIDPRSNSIFWRGTASQVVNHPYAPDMNRLDKAVAKLVEQYPSMMASVPRSTM